MSTQESAYFGAFDPQLQSSAIADLIQYASLPPDISSSPYHLNHQLDKLRNWIIPAFTGLMARYPDRSSVYIPGWSEEQKAAANEGSPVAFLKDNWQFQPKLRGSLRPLTDDPAHLVATIRRGRASFVRYIDEDFIAGVELPLGGTLSQAPTALFQDRNRNHVKINPGAAPDVSDADPVCMNNVYPRGLPTFNRYGQVGLYQVSLHTVIRQLLSGLGCEQFAKA